MHKCWVRFIRIITSPFPFPRDITRPAWREYGPPKGHRKGVFGVELMNYLEARQQIYLPSYKWVLDNVPIVHQLVEKIKNEAQKSDIVFLDYSTNTDVYNVSTPLSHAGLIKSYIEDSYPQLVESI